MKRKSKKPLERKRKPSSEHASTASTRSIPARSRRWLFRLTAVLVIPLVVLLTLEAGLRLAGYGCDTHFFRKWRIGDELWLVQNEDFSRRFFPPQTLRHPAAVRMKAEKPADTIRIFILGESAAMGDPEPTYGPSRYLEALLWQRYPDVDFEVVNVAFTAINSHVILPIARECAERDGDLWIIYMGNNEMVGPYGAVTVFGMQSPPRSFVKLALALKRTRLGQLGMALSRRLQETPADAASWGGMQMFVENRVAPDSPKRDRVYRNFEGNLEDILDEGLSSGAAVVLNSVAVNLRGSPPFASMANEALRDEVRTRFTAAFDAGRQAEITGDDVRAAELFGEACELDPGYAEAHYRRASCLDRLGRLDEARKHYQLACDTDALPFRTDSRLNNLIRQAAQRHEGDRLRFLDAEARLPQPGSSISGSESFYEHVHFNFDGAYHLGMLWAASVEEALPASVRQRSADEWASQESCDRRLGLTDWNRKLVTEAVLRRLQQPPLSTQFNNPDRIQTLRDYEQKLLSGMTEETVRVARELYEAAIAKRPEDHFLYEAYGNFMQATGDLPGATRQWQIAARLLPHDFLPWFQVGVLEARQGNHPQAQENLRKALERRPGLVQGWSELGQSLAIERRWEPALEAFQRACALRPQDPMLWAYQAKVLASMGRHLEAVDLYRKAIELRPDYWEAHGALGDQYSQLDRLPEAIASYESAIRAKPDYATAHLNLGVTFVKQGRLEEGIREFEETLKIDPNNPTARDYLRRAQNYKAPRK